MNPGDIILRHHFSASHLASSKFLSGQARQLEMQTDVGWIVKSADKRAHHASVCGSIVASSAFLEASLNEFFFETSRGWPGLSSVATARAVDAWKLLQGGKGLRPLEKYQFALLTLDRQTFDKGAQPFQDAALAVQFRNLLVHAELENEDNSRSLEGRYSGKFTTLAQSGTRGWFPDRALCAACADWVRKSCANLVLDFYERIGIDYFTKLYEPILTSD